MIYAKSNPEERLREHTDRLLKCYDQLKENYGYDIEKCITIDKERFWQLLKLCCEYHDFGKANITFQNIIRHVLKLPELEDKIKENIPHNYLSPAFIPYKELEKEEKRLVIQAIGYHHERDNEPDVKIIKKIIDEDLSNRLFEINKEMGSSVEKLNKKFTKDLSKRYRIKQGEDIYKTYIMLKGLLHRIDHAASAHVGEIEETTIENVGNTTISYIENKLKGTLREPQVFVKNNKDKNILLIGSTGIGKTESALIWIDNSKGFFTLPLRVSINALFTRVKDEIGFECTGLIHSTSMDYLDEEGYENSSEIYEQSKLLCKKLSFSTIDQIFKFPFKYKGYEKIYSSLAYSKVVIDEIQAYSPEITAVILKGLYMISQMGGKFMIMTATLPRIYRDYLNKQGIKMEEKTFLLPIKRHKISVNDNVIDFALELIIERGTENKVLVIVNTVKKAVEIYKSIKEDRRFQNCFLLHSMFIQKDRSKLEKDIKNFTDNNNCGNGIWITTQIVEASLDVDFDYLFTEMCTLDSLFQRFGRCYRKRAFDKDEPNIYIFTKEPTGRGTIYDELILDRSIQAIKKFNNQLMEESDKFHLVDELYSRENLLNTEFYKKFMNALSFLDNVLDYDLVSSEAQKVLRDIDSLRIIPKDIYDSNLSLFEEYERCDIKDKFGILSKINKLTLNIPKYKLYKCKEKPMPHSKIKNLYILNCKYDSKKGIILEEVASNIF